jgi:hypothetical protein
MDMIVDPASESEILRATAILLLRILAVQPGLWTSEGPGLLGRDVALRLQIEEILKGEVRQAVQEPFELTVRQRRPEGTRIQDYLGLWSHVALEEGAELLAFCRGESDDARALLTEEGCEQLLDRPQEALEDARAALALEAEGLPALEILARAENLAGRHGPVFARYVVARSRIVPFAPAFATAPEDTMAMSAMAPEPPAGEAFEALVRRLEDPRTAPLARDAYLRSIVEELGLTSPPPPARVTRLIEALQRLLEMPEAGDLRETIQDVYLPNLRRMEHGEP